MKEAKPASSSPTPDSATPVQPANISPGMATLLRRNDPRPETQTEPKTAQQTPESKAGAEIPLMRVSLVVADLLLFGLAACLAWRKGSFGFMEIGLCVLALALGAWLTCLALWFGKKR